MTIKPSSLEELLHHVLEDCGRTKGAVATDMGVPLSTLSREVSLFDEKAKFGAAALVPFMRATRSVAPLRFIAQALGFGLVPLNGAPGGENMHHEVLQGMLAVGFFAEQAEAGAHYTALSEPLEKAKKELDDVFIRARNRDTGGVL